MKRIYFYDSSRIPNSLAFGQMLELLWACYTRGKELGYDDIVVEWHDNITIRWFDDGACVRGMLTPNNSVFRGVKVVNKGTPLRRVDMYIDISKPNSLYEGCPPLVSKSIRAKIYEEYLEDYCNQTGIKSKIEIIKTNPKEKYVIFHYRKSEKTNQIKRNVPEETYVKLIKYIKDNYPNYKIYKIGEDSSFDSMVDETFPYFLDNTEKLISLIGNSTLYIGALSGPVSIAFFSQHPCMALMSEQDVEKKTPLYNHYSDDTIFIKDFDVDYDIIEEYMRRILK